MITTMLIALLVLAIVSVVVFFRAVKRTVDGFEDEYGFHEAVPDSDKELEFAFTQTVTVSKPREAQVEVYGTKRALKRATGLAVRRGTTPSFPY